MKTGCYINDYYQRSRPPTGPGRLSELKRLELVTAIHSTVKGYIQFASARMNATVVATGKHGPLKEYTSNNPIFLII
ncbi:protein of unknown function [Xenorhabdus doucetiae]|uniref:Uncharacterized protein n=1 Tax=Xenorhabdus doucetiae TaxID=351671 RepID=A0A068QUG7_9GAMM|nr:protein of unknown function [Xenorhabdus doucetiae]